MQNRQTAQSINSDLDVIISGEQIPALRAGVPQLLTKLSQNDIDIAELGETIAEFPGVASRLLFLANSAWSAPIVPIDTIHHACSKLGLSVIRSVTIALSIATPFNPLKCKSFDIKKHWLNALMVGYISKTLAQELDSIPKSQTGALQTAGILHNIGLLWLADRLPAETALAIVDYTNNPQISLEQHLINHCNFGCGSVNGKLAHAWNLPLLSCTIISNHHLREFDGQYHHQTHSVGLATAICEHVLSETPNTESFTDRRMRDVGLNDEALEHIVALARAKKDRIDEMIKIFTQN